MHRSLAFAAAAVLSFVATTLYLRHRHEAIREPEQVASASTAARTKERAKVSPMTVNAPAEPSIVQVFEMTPEADDADELRQVADYVGGISNYAPVSTEQKKALRQAILRHKRTYEIAMRDSGLERVSLSTAEREHAHQLVARALRDFRDDFLVEAKSILTDTQYDQLASYENTAFLTELNRMQKVINAK